MGKTPCGREKEWQVGRAEQGHAALVVHIEFGLCYKYDGKCINQLLLQKSSIASNSQNFKGSWQYFVVDGADDALDGEWLWLNFSLLTLFQTHWPSCCFANIPSMLWFQGLCNCYFLYLKHCSLRHWLGPFLQLIHALLKCQLLGETSSGHAVENNSTFPQHPDLFFP